MMKLHKIHHKPNGKIDWRRSWFSAKENTPANLIEANLRGLYDDEVVLDFESREEARIGKIRLRMNKVSYRAYSTESRGEHIHITIPSLKSLDELKRRLYREVMINDYGSDPSKKSGWLAMENKIHFKSGKLKRLIEVFDVGVNKINFKYLIKANKEYEKITNVDDVDVEYVDEDILSIAKRAGFVVTSRVGDEVIGYIENSSKKRHFWVNVKKQCYYDFHKDEGGGVFNLLKYIKK